jgi:HK97 family phage major capsid protein
MTYKEILARLKEVGEEMVALGEKDEPTEEELARFEELGSEADELETKKEAAEARATRIERVKELSKDPGKVIGGSQPDDLEEDPLGEPDSIPTRIRQNPWDFDALRASLFASPEQAVAETRSRALAAVEKTPGLSSRARERVTRLLEASVFADDEDGFANIDPLKLARHVLAVSSPEYIRNWGRALRSLLRTGSPDPAAMSVLHRAMSLTDAAGGHAVPLPIDPTLIMDDDGSVNPFRQIATVKTTTADEYKTVNSGHPNFSFDAEATEVSDDATTFGQITITIRKAQGVIPYSVEIGMDYPNFTQDMAELMARGKDDLEATVFATGAGGSNQPIGIVTALTGTASEITSNTTDVFALSDVYDLEEELPARFRSRASWVANKRIYQATREAGGANLDDFWANLGQGQPRQLLGYPSYESDQMDGVIDAAADNRVLILGDFSWYWIVDRIGFVVELVPHLFGAANRLPTGQRGLYCWWRVGADSVLDRAFRMLNVT